MLSSVQVASSFESYLNPSSAPPKQEKRRVDPFPLKRTFTPLPLWQNLEMKRTYYDTITKGKKPIKGRRPVFHVVVANPASGKSTAMRKILANDPNIVMVERDDLVMLYPRLEYAMRHNPTKWGRGIRVSEGIDRYVDRDLIDGLMEKRYDVLHSTVTNLIEHVDKAKKADYDPKMNLIMVPTHVAKLRSIRRFLSAPPNSTDRRVILAKQYDDPVKGFDVRMKAAMKKLYDKYPNFEISVIYQLNDADKHKKTTIRSYNDFIHLHDMVNQPPTDMKIIKSYNDEIKHWRNELYRQFPPEKHLMPMHHFQQTLDLMHELPVPEVRKGLQKLMKRNLARVQVA
ncbi:MAG: zeta toxin family protein [Pseudomonadota bacterium]